MLMESHGALCIRGKVGVHKLMSRECLVRDTCCTRKPSELHEGAPIHKN